MTMFGVGIRRAIATIGTIGLLLSPAVGTAQPAEAAAAEAVDAASDAARVAAEAAGSTIDIPYSPPGTDAVYRVTFQLKDDQAKAMITEHKKLCESQGSSRCQVEEFSSERNDYGGAQIALRLRLPSGTAPALIASLGKLGKEAGFKVEQNPGYQHSENSQAELKLRRTMLLAQQAKLRELQASASADQQSVINRQFGSISSQLAQLDQQLAISVVKPRSDVLMINYQDPSASHRTRTSRQLDEMLSGFGLALLAVTGVALLTVLYFAIMGLGFLWVRRFARRRGLLKGPVGETTS
jgi:hypothetical protein